jgi:ABC-2 type transport system ATP-binding protein
MAKLPAAQTLQVDIEGEIDIAALASLSGVKRAQRSGERVTLAMDDLTRDGCGVLQALAAADCKVRHISSDRGNLEDVFLALTGRQLRD